MAGRRDETKQGGRYSARTVYGRLARPGELDLTLLYAALKALHLLAVIAWVGGMFFVLACLRPALTVLQPPQRLALMVAVLERFLRIVMVAMTVVLAAGGAMLWIALDAGLRVPHAWYAMILLGIVMMGVAGQVRGPLLRRLKTAAAAGDAAAGGVVLGIIRQRVVLNLVLGVVIVLAMRLGTAI